MAGPAHEAQHARKDTFHDHACPRRVWMESVRLVEGGHGGDAVEQEWIEERVVPGGEFRVDRVEARAVALPEVAGGQHPGEEDREAALGERAEQPVKVRPGKRRIDRSQGIICSERHDDGVGAIRQRPFKPREPPGRGVARYSGVDHLHVETVIAKRRLQPGGKRIAGSESVARGQAVAEHEDAERPGPCLRPESGRGQREPCCKQPRERRPGSDREPPRLIGPGVQDREAT